LCEGHNGSVPTGDIIIFANGNKKNMMIDNLLLSSKRQLAMINIYKLI